MRKSKNNSQRKRKRKIANELITRVSDNIRKFRIKSELTQEQLQEISGADIYRCESGKRDMTLTTINKLSKHLKVEPYELLK